MLQKPSTCRLRHRCTPSTFRERLTCAVQHHPDLTTEQIANAARIRYDRLLRYCNDPASNIPAETLRDVVSVTGRIDLFDALLGPLGYHATPLPGAAGGESLIESCLDVQAAVGRLSERVRHALADHVRTEEERLELLACVEQIRRELADVDHALRRPPPAPRVVAGGRR